jgi:hypothetical protein
MAESSLFPNVGLSVLIFLDRRNAALLLHNYLLRSLHLNSHFHISKLRVSDKVPNPAGAVQGKETL